MIAIIGFSFALENAAEMSPAQLSYLLNQLLAHTHETEWLEWKRNKADPEVIGRNLSGLANSGVLHGRGTAYMIWGIEDDTRAIVGTSFRPREAKKGNEELQNWLMRSLRPQVDFKIHEWLHEGKPMVMFEIPCVDDIPVRFRGNAYVRVGSLTKRLDDYPPKEKALWTALTKTQFEKGIARSDLSGDEVLSSLRFVECLKLLGIPLPKDQQRVLERLVQEDLIVAAPEGKFDITNLGAVLFAEDLRQFDLLDRKALRVIKYEGAGRTRMEREWRDAPSRQGYAVAFSAMLAYIASQLPHSEPIGQAFREEIRAYPETAIRELVANALIHQDFSVAGAGPLVEIFDQRVEITNPGAPLIDPQRFLDFPPKARNPKLAAMMRRMQICEEAGTGVDKVVEEIEDYRLPAAEFRLKGDNTQVALFGPKKFSDMTKPERVHACYQHSCLRYVQGKQMTNMSLRERFGLPANRHASISRVIRNALDAELVKMFENGSAVGRGASYVPFWA